MAIGILGLSCRLPGAANEDSFWRLLDEGRCSVTEVGTDRFETGRFLHPRKTERGFAYTFAAGIIDDPAGFDHGVFGISAREVPQIDPQQRILLEVTYEALLDAGLRPSALAGTDTAVFVGASMLDYGNRHTNDGAAIEAHFMTGNSMSILSNRISYAFDLKGPSATIDTACSSGMVAFDEGVRAIETGRAEFAVVAGVNLILSMAPFVGFSRAGMLSPTGRCRSFSADADGYVRSEGAVSVVIGRLDAARARGVEPRAIVVATGVNSDGRTTGISLPSLEGQRSLLETLYSENGVDPDSLAFVEAHGTGTRAGDPIEAGAIGTVIGRNRREKLPIGSVKSNIGHLEPASGLAGLMKAVLALEHRRYPASLHLEAPNPDIPFGDLGLAPAVEAVDLSALPAPLSAGISSFGFGGTNAHAVLREPRADERIRPLAGRAATPRRAPALHEDLVPPPVLLLSAASETSLRAVAGQTAALFARDPARAGLLARALVHRRDLMNHRLALPARDIGRAQDALAAIGAGETAAGAVLATSFRKSAPTAFVFVGNGTQQAGMGRAAYAANAAFRAKFDAIDALFRPIAGWSLVSALADETTFGDRLVKTSFAQPLIFAVQSATVAALADAGLAPDLVFGHSVGEIAAAEAAGVLALPEAVRLIHERSDIQEAVFDQGLMAAAAMTESDARAFCAELDGRIEIAAINSPSSVTLSGPTEAMKEAVALGRQRRVAMRQLDIRYPFHSSLLDGHRAAFRTAIGAVATGEGPVAFVSSVTGAALSGDALDADYWWRNVREPVRFREAVDAAAAAGIRLFVEIGAKTILTGAVADALRERGIDADVIPSSVQGDAEGADPVEALFLRALTKGARVDASRAFGAPPRGRIDLPAYPWQHESLWIPGTSEAVDTFGTTPIHPLAGGRLLPDSNEWRAFLDTVVVPYLSDHRVDGEAVMPGAGLAEMAFAAGAAHLGPRALALEDFDILQPLVLSDKEMRDVRTTLVPATGAVEVRSRRRLAEAGEAWTVHARGRVVLAHAAARIIEAPGPEGLIDTSAHEIYDVAGRAGLDYGPHFRLVEAVRRDADTIEIDLSPARGGAGPFSMPHRLHPAVLDAAFHGLFAVYKTPKPGEKKAFLPVRFTRLQVEAEVGTIVKARVFVERDTDDTLLCDIVLLDAAGRVAASLDGALFRSVLLSRLDREALLFHLAETPLAAGPRDRARLRTLVEEALTAEEGAAGDASDALVLLDAFSRALAHRTLLALAGRKPVSLDDLAAAGTIAPGAVALAARLAWTLEAAGLATETDGAWRFAPRSGLPAPEVLLRTLMADYPLAASEIALCAQLLDGLEAALRTGERPALRAALLDHVETASLLHAGAIAAAVAAVGGLVAALPEGTLRVLVAEPASEGLVRALCGLLGDGRVEIAVASGDRTRLELARARAEPVRGLSFVAADALVPGRYDVAFGIAGRAGDEALTAALLAALAPQAPLCLFHPQARAFCDLALGAAQMGEDAVLAGLFPPSLVPAPEEAERALREVGAGTESHAVEDGTWLVGWRDADTAAVTVPADRPPVIVFAPTRTLEPDARALAAALGARGRSVSVASSLPDAVESALEIVLVQTGGASSAPRTALAEGMLHLRLAAEKLSAGPSGSRLWLVTANALSEGEKACDGVAYALRSVARVVGNEYGAVEMRTLDICGPALPRQAAAAAAALDAPGAETELVLRAGTLSTLRAERGQPSAPGQGEAEAAALTFRRKGSFESFLWAPATRRAPEPGEIEIEMHAAGLNFRDVMFALGILPEEILEGGFAGAVVGFEGAGRVVRVGAGVTDLVPGEAVMAFAPGAFASHVTVPRAVAVKVPDGLPLDAAATMPVAFLTAWYALVTKGGLARGERVLVHGAAGGVGLAAIQIAKMKGAHVVATAGSADKRAFARLAGADHVYDSRSLTFARDVLAETGGVDIVLNSLAGDAMEASVRTLKPFGRFIELGKRDFVENTRLGLRPFRQNLSYFGVDVDQLLAHDARLAARLMRQLGVHFGTGRLSPLPYRAFAAHDIAAAFRLMQGSGHIGKIVVRPPVHRPAPDRSEPFAIAAEGVQLIVGGLGGFGFETAAWLAARGARTIVAASRRGAVPPEHAARVEALRESGVTFVAEAVDVSDAASVKALVARVTKAYGPIRGAFHTAVVLDDGLMTTLTPERIDAVLAPKVDGADHLDRALADAPLDHFVVYSSVSAFIGNPGQGSYVAANAYLEALIRRRRAAGKPGLAIGWGRIADVGLLARDAELDAKVSRVLGATGLKSAEALAILGDIMERDRRFGPSVGSGTVVCAPMHASAAARAMAIVRSPTFAGLYGEASQAETTDTLDLRALIADKSDGEAREIVGGILAEQVGRILRTAASQIDMGRPLSELGLDSLMALELRLQIGNQLGVELPLVAISAGKSLGDLSSRLVLALREGDGGASATEAGAEGAGLHRTDVETALAQHTTQVIAATKIDSLLSILNQPGANPAGLKQPNPAKTAP